jgi:amidase
MNIVVQDVQIGRGALKVMVKDSIDIQGLKTMIGSKALMDKPSATKNAEVVERILAADCQITAKPIYMSWLLVLPGSIPFGTAINPQYPDLIPGGSSSGSALP